jgi:hypothetical protein
VRNNFHKVIFPTPPQVIKAHRGQHQQMNNDIVELAHFQTMKELLDHPDTQKQYAALLTQLYEAIFSEDERDMFRASWKIHNWDVSRGMNPVEVTECLVGREFNIVNTHCLIR